MSADTDSPATAVDGLTVNKLTEAERAQVVRWAAEFHPQSEIIRLVRDRFEKHISQQAVSHLVNSRAWAGELTVHQRQFLSDYSRVPLAHRRIILERLERLYQAADEHTPQGRQERARYLTIALDVISEKGSVHIWDKQVNFFMHQNDQQLWERIEQSALRLYASMNREQLERHRASIETRLKHLGGFDESPVTAQLCATPVQDAPV